ncbi:type III toxin-antitoxin system ToxN/AbiQ family toxin [Enterococcus thailandicus]|uniref:type III toxin-antitoxin system ToxN/AbiQ family toxin n=1 Tax=Enterococcus TaxID=1350 RepID=UPI00115D6D4D|nr:type III toxin-antitoxin system ToxN/AbiQ family toxin [Enterococcus faecalis]EKN1389212.1 type III toxin-antitoxin system ToxN/AbiQ family toxin [Enterococcus faecalis]MBP4075795.1 type III toxin-antitoxin system ToxN/AbiQ family toxin [Enterococcus faecalis]MBP4093682.1 type III toxin-antitoxin system ToxN/AbiQ family toxin [Enterococcus faecalis]NSV60741.1 type III toxin-antitoxin system ToxN/AbiQ family toxin [Enterococcus faecalis]
MDRLQLFEIEPTYIDFLKQYDDKIPNHDYDTHDKLYCGVVLIINDLKYLVPLSSFNKRQATNLLIRDRTRNNRIIASLRFCFMIPVLDEVIKIKDFSEETDTNYVALLSKELRYCRTHANEIYAKALEVYSFGTDETHPQYINCCKFKVLELNCKNYNNI